MVLTIIQYALLVAIDVMVAFIVVLIVAGIQQAVHDYKRRKAKSAIIKAEIVKTMETSANISLEDMTAVTDRTLRFVRPSSLTTTYLLQEGFLRIISTEKTISVVTTYDVDKYFDFSRVDECQAFRNKATGEVTYMDEDFCRRWNSADRA